MVDNRTTRVLGALLVSMTLGALILMLMENKSPRPGRRDMAAVVCKIVDKSWDNKSSDKRWKRVVVRTSAGDDSMPEKCHFVVYETPDKGIWVKPTDYWKNQIPGTHTYANNYNADSIGVCIIGDFSKQKPSPKQFHALVSLVTHLQKLGGISADRVIFERDLNIQNNDAKKYAQFPLDRFEELLKR